LASSRLQQTCKSLDCKSKGTVKTLSEAQAIVDAEVTAAQTAWDALSDAEKAPK
jgi:hypothetical protein